MPATVPDLWGDLNIEDHDISTPAGLMRQQAALLSEKTNGRVEARVVAYGSDKGVVLEFTLASPAIPNYSYTLFHAMQTGEVYPVSAEGELISERTAFERWLASKLSSGDTKRKIKILLETAGSQEPRAAEDLY